MFVLVLIIGFGALVAGSMRHKTSLTSDLVLDLEGGTQLILTPTTSDDSAIGDNDVEQAIEMIRQRVDAFGVSGAQVSRQDGQNIVVSLPGKPNQATLELVCTSAAMYFRPILRTLPGGVQQAVKNIASQNPSGEPAPAQTAQPSPNAGSEATRPAADSEGTQEDSGQGGQVTVVPVPTTQLTTQSAAQPRIPEEIAKQLADVNQDGVIPPDPLPARDKTSSSDSWITEKLLYNGYMTDCFDSKNLTGQTQDPKVVTISCSREAGPQHQGAYTPGPTEITDTEFKGANSGLGTGPRGQATHQWIVLLAFNAGGTKKFAELSKRLLTYHDQASATGTQGAQGTQNQDSQAKARFVIILGGLTITAPGLSETVHSPVTDGRVQITSGSDQNQVSTLANQLSFDPPPLSFTVQSEQQISATLGTEQLCDGLTARLIGFTLIILHLVWQYRGLAVVAMVPLMVVAVGTYLVIAALSVAMGYRLSLAGVAGLIISVGITVGSFIIYSECIHDEVHWGRALRAAIDEGWEHARRMTLVSDVINLVAAIALYFLVVDRMQGLAFILGATTRVDLITIILFAHPAVERIVRFRFFNEGHHLFGLGPGHLRATSLTYGKGREAVADRVVGLLTRRKAEVRRSAESTGDAAEESDDTAADNDAEQQEGDAVDGATGRGRDSEMK